MYEYQLPLFAVGMTANYHYLQSVWLPTATIGSRYDYQLPLLAVSMTANNAYLQLNTNRILAFVEQQNKIYERPLQLVAN